MLKVLNIVKTIFTGIQLAVLIPPIGLEYYAHTKMGVYRYLIFKRRQFESTYFTPGYLQMYELLLVSGILVLFMLAFRSYKSRNNRKQNYAIYSSLLLNVFVLGFVTLVNPLWLKAYHFFLIALFIILAIQYSKAGLKRTV